MRYYDGLYSTVAAAEASGSPTRKWVIKTDEDGFCRLDTAWLVSGDALYTTPAGDATLPVGTILIHETEAPKGYFLNDEVYLVKITESGADQIITNTYNAPITPEQVLTGNIQITKTTRTGLDKHVVLENGAVFQIYLKSAGSYAAAAATDRALLTTDANGVAKATGLPYGTYTVHQTKGWEGSELCDDFDVTISTNGKTYSYEIENERFYSEVQLMKLDSRTGLLIPEANVGFQIKYPNGSFVSYNGTDTWYTNSEGVLTLPMELEYGKGYQAIEVSAPDGYVLSSTPIKFDVTADAATTVGRDTVILVNVNNTPTSVEVSKVDVDGSGVSGATLQVLNDSDRVVDEWTSDGTVHMIYGLSIGGHYTLHEKAAPAGYVLAKDVSFTVADTTAIQPVSMTDKRVFIEKLDAEGNAVSGATLQILDADGYVVDEWITDGSAHSANNLVIGESYTLHEAETPEGYVHANDVPFTVAVKAETQTVSMIDKRLLIEKIDPYGNPVAGAVLQVLDEQGAVIDEWVSDGTSYAVIGLEAGKSYILREDEAPDGWLLSYDLPFTVEDDGLDQTVRFENEEIPLLRSMATVDERHEAFAKADITLNDVVMYEKLVPGREYVMEGTLLDKDTGKQLEDKEGNPLTSSVTFTPSESSGSIVVPFTYTPIAGSTVVVYQQIYKNDRLLASHEDIEDENQTVHFPSIDSSATVNEKKEISCTSEMTLVDIVYFQNLEVGKEYTVTGLLMDKRTGEAYAVKKDAEPITASATFTPEAANGSVSLTFALTSSQFSRTTTLVVFDELYDGDYLVAEHEDIEDEDQTVEIRVHYGSPEEVDPADSGDTGIALYVALANISYIGSCLLIRQRRERK